MIRAQHWGPLCICSLSSYFWLSFPSSGCQPLIWVPFIWQDHSLQHSFCCFTGCTNLFQKPTLYKGEEAAGDAGRGEGVWKATQVINYGSKNWWRALGKTLSWHFASGLLLHLWLTSLFLSHILHVAALTQCYYPLHLVYFNYLFLILSFLKFK